MQTPQGSHQEGVKPSAPAAAWRDAGGGTDPCPQSTELGQGHVLYVKGKCKQDTGSGPLQARAQGLHAPGRRPTKPGAREGLAARPPRALPGPVFRDFLTLEAIKRVAERPLGGGPGLVTGHFLPHCTRGQEEAGRP